MFCWLSNKEEQARFLKLLYDGREILISSDYCKKVMIGGWFVGRFWLDKNGWIASLGMQTVLVRRDGHEVYGFNGNECHIMALATVELGDSIEFHRVFDHTPQPTCARIPIVQVQWA